MNPTLFWFHQFDFSFFLLGEKKKCDYVTSNPRIGGIGSRASFRLGRTLFPNDVWSKKNILTHLEFHKAFVLENPFPVAYSLVCETPWEVEIFRIATIPEFRRNRYGTMLLEEIFRIFPGKDFFLESE